MKTERQYEQNKRDEDAIELDKLAEQARVDPSGYRRHIIKLALLGYGYMAGAVMLLFVVLGLTVILMFHFTHVVALKLVFLPLIAIWLIAKSLWVKFEAPEGIIVKRSEAPKLFALVEEIRAAAKSPPVDTILLDGEFNCSVVQMPRLGVFGWYKNYLCLGLPLMSALSESHFKAVLAHEMGHLSELHGKFGCWIYHVQNSWWQLVQNLSQHSALGTALFLRFANWYFPMFAKHTLVLRRQQEHAADQIAANLVGAEAASLALINVAVKGYYTGNTFWSEVSKKVTDLPEPPKQVLSLLHQELQEKITEESARESIALEDGKHNEFDSHPTLSERVRALGMDGTREGIFAAYEHGRTSFNNETPASDSLLGAALPDLRTNVEQRWEQLIRPQWIAGHAQQLHLKKRLSELEQLSQSQKLSEKQVIEKANYYYQLGDTRKSKEILQAVLAIAPNNAEANFRLGAILHTEKDEQAADYLKTSIECSPQFAYEACELLANLFQVQNDKATAEIYSQKAEEYALELMEAQRIQSRISNDDKYEPHTLTSFELNRLCRVLHAELRVKQAWLVSRNLPAILGSAQHILIVKLGSPGWFIVSQEELTSALDLLARQPELAGMYLHTWEGIPKNLGSACKNFAGAFIYDRNTWKPEIGSTNVDRLLAIPQPVSKPQSFFASNKALIIVWAVLGTLIASVIISSISYHDQRPGEMYNQDIPRGRTQEYTHAGIDYRPYMNKVQRKIHSYWRPPSSKESRHVTMRFKILRDGSIRDLKVVRSSGVPAMDSAGKLAVSDAVPFEPLPAGSPKAIEIEFTLDYNVQ